MVRSAPPETWRARCAANRTRSNLFDTLSTQSSTVTRAIDRSESHSEKGIWDVRKAAPIACGGSKSQGKRSAMADTSQRARPGAIRATVAGNRLELIETGEQRLAAILSLIGGAK